ncbi:MAG: poly(R)-hydroxyalkanoic acid synthase subunit PhaE [Pseudomonadota bacterium]
MNQVQQGLFSADLWPGFQPSPAPPAALGPSREWELAASELQHAAERLWAAQSQMQEHTMGTFEGANQRFWKEMGKGEGELSSLKEVYDYWVNCAEEAYAERVMTEAYSRDFGEAINAQAAFKVKLTALIDRFLETLNIPNRRELNGIIEHISRLEQRLATLETTKSESANATEEIVKDLQTEIASLNRSVVTQETKESASKVTNLNVKPKKAAKRQAAATKKSKESDKSVKKGKSSKEQKRASKRKSKAEFHLTDITAIKK